MQLLSQAINLKAGSSMLTLNSAPKEGVSTAVKAEDSRKGEALSSEMTPPVGHLRRTEGDGLNNGTAKTVAKSEESSSGMSAQEAALKKLKEQIEQVQECINQTQEQLVKAKSRAAADPSQQPALDALMGQLAELSGELSTLMGAYLDMMKESVNQQNNSGTLVQTSA